MSREIIWSSYAAPAPVPQPVEVHETKTVEGPSKNHIDKNVRFWLLAVDPLDTRSLVNLCAQVLTCIAVLFCLILLLIIVTLLVAHSPSSASSEAAVHVAECVAHLAPTFVI